MSCHRALSVLEILDNICLYLDYPSLAHLARAARRFHLPASSSLWQKVTPIALEALLDILLPKAQHGRHNHTRFAQSRWQRFETYAGQIRTLHYWPPEISDHDSSLPEFQDMVTLSFDEIDNSALSNPDSDLRHRLQLLNPIRGSSEPFKRLRTITWQAVKADDLISLTSFVSPSLQEVQIACWGRTIQPINEADADRWRLGFQCVADAISRHASKLKNLGVMFNIPRSLYERRLCTLLSELADLRGLGLAIFPTSTLVKQVMNHPSLRSLTVNLENVDLPHQALAPRLGKRASSTITSVSLWFMSPDMAIAMIPLLPALQAISMQIWCEEVITEVQLTNIALALGSLKELTKIELYITENPESAEAPVLDATQVRLLDANGLAGLSTCSALQIFGFRMTSYYTRVIFNTATFEWMARAWPQLQSLFLTTGDDSALPVEVPVVSLNDILTLAESCPELIVVLVSRLSAVDTPLLPTIQQRRSLMVSFMDDSPLANPQAMAVFLVLGWPQIEFRPTPPVQEAWVQLIQHIEVLKLHHEMQRGIDIATKEEQPLRPGEFPRAVRELFARHTLLPDAGGQ